METNVVENELSIKDASKSFVETAQNSFKEIVKETFGIDGDPADIVEKYKQENLSSLTIKGTDDTAGYKKAVGIRAIARTTRTSIEKKRKELKSIPLEMGKEIDKYASELTELVLPIEEKANEEISRIDNEKENIRLEKERLEQERVNARINSLYELGMTFNGSDYVFGDLKINAVDVKHFPDADFDKFKETVKVEADKKEAERIEFERLKAEDAERVEKQRIENERIAEEQRVKEELLRKEQERIEAEKNALEESKRREVERKQREIELEKARKEAAEKALKDAADKAKRDEELRIAAEKVAAEKEAKRLARQPDKVKLIEFANKMAAIELPQVKSEEAKELLAKASKSFKGICDLLKSEAGKL